MKKFTLIFGIAFILFSCNSDKKKSSDSQSSKSAKKAKSYDCLKRYEDNYDKLVTKKELASVYPFDMDEVKEELSNGSYGEYIVSWPSDRPDIKMEVAGMKMNVPDLNAMGVKNLSFSSDKTKLETIRKNFDMGYKKLSDEELKAIEKNLEESSEEIRDAGKSMMKTRKERKSEFVDGIGSSAWYRWNERYGGELVVLAGRAKFTVRLKISEDPEENKELCMKLAVLVLEKCG